MSYTLAENGKVLTETQEGITMPADYSFATVNDYVHGMEVHFEDLQALCLGMADHIDKLRRGEFICKRCGLMEACGIERPNDRVEGRDSGLIAGVPLESTVMRGGSND